MKIKHSPVRLMRVYRCMKGAYGYGDKTQEIIKKLQIGIEGLFESEKYTEYLRFPSRFHSYSASNCLLIAMQCPDAMLIASYTDWQRQKRQVKRSAKAITSSHRIPTKRRMKTATSMNVWAFMLLLYSMCPRRIAPTERTAQYRAYAGWYSVGSTTT